MQRSNVCRVYLGLAVLGAAVTWYYNLKFMLASGGVFDPVAFISDGFANHAAASLSADVGIAAATFIIWMVIEARRLGMRHWWAYIVLTFGVALAFAFPFFLYRRERHLRQCG